MTELIIVQDNNASPVITLFRDHATATKAFNGQGAEAADLLDGNTILELNGYSTPSSIALVKRIETCAFGPHPNPRPSSYYQDTYEHPYSGRAVISGAGCLGCHVIGQSGNDGPGENLNDIGSRLTATQIAHALEDPPPPMPSFRGMRRSDPRAWRALVSYLGHLRAR